MKDKQKWTKRSKQLSTNKLCNNDIFGVMIHRMDPCKQSKLFQLWLLLLCCFYACSPGFFQVLWFPPIFQNTPAGTLVMINSLVWMTVLMSTWISVWIMCVHGAMWWAWHCFTPSVPRKSSVFAAILTMMKRLLNMHDEWFIFSSNTTVRYFCGKSN